MAQRLKTDWVLFVTVIAMVSVGLLAVYSASSVIAELKHGSIWYFVKRQAIWAVVAICALMWLKKTDYRKYQAPGAAFGAIGVATALLIAVFFLDPAHHRWLRVGPTPGRIGPPGQSYVWKKKKTTAGNPGDGRRLPMSIGSRGV